MVLIKEIDLKMAALTLTRKIMEKQRESDYQSIDLFLKQTKIYWYFSYLLSFDTWQLDLMAHKLYQKYHDFKWKRLALINEKPVEMVFEKFKKELNVSLARKINTRSEAVTRIYYKVILQS